MSDSTFELAIDFGGTSAKLACYRSGSVEFVSNQFGELQTPCAVWQDMQDNLSVGRRAIEALQTDPGNVFIDFKRHLGTDKEYIFARSGQKMSSEDLSVEVLKSLRADAEMNAGQPIDKAVLTVPGYFDHLQLEATRQCAARAGFAETQLLLEPIAAALGCGLDRNDNQGYRLIYDFSGDEFCATLLLVEDGSIQIIGCGGDNKSGGRTIDRAIVQELLVPALTSDYSLTDFDMNNPRWRGAFETLMHHAEAAKIRLSSLDSTEVVIDSLCHDDRGEAVQLNIKLTRSELEQMATPFIRSTINICKDTIVARGLSLSDINRIVLAGGTSLLPFLQDQLQDHAVGLGIPIESSVDPLTVIVRGAALFAGNQKRQLKACQMKSRQNLFEIMLDYCPVSRGLERIVGGKVINSDSTNIDFHGFTIEFIKLDLDNRQPWRSGEIPVDDGGYFTSTVLVGQDGPSIFQIELRDSDGMLMEIKPSAIELRLSKAVCAHPVLPHALGVVIANNGVLRIMEKGAFLPARCRVSLRTEVALKAGQSGEVLELHLVEGESQRADQNREIGILAVPLELIRRDLPKGAEIEVTIQIDESRQISIRAYIPLLDEQFEEILAPHRATASSADLANQLTQLRLRLDTVLATARKLDDNVALRAVQVPLENGVAAEIEKLLPLTIKGTDATSQCTALLEILGSAIAEAEAALEWTTSLRDFKQDLLRARELLTQSEHTSDLDLTELSDLERMAKEAIDRRDLLRLRDCSNSLSSLFSRVVRQEPTFWLAWLEQISHQREEFRDPLQGANLLDRARRAIDCRDSTGLQQAIRGLLDLLPSDYRSAGHSSVLSPNEETANRPTKDRRRTSEVPASRIDSVHFSVSYPPAARIGSAFLVDVWAHIERQRAEVERQIQLANPEPNIPRVIRPKGPFRIQRGTRLFVRLKFQDLLIEPSEEVILWEGGIGNASFSVEVTMDIPLGLKIGLVTIHWEGTLQIARVPIQVLVALTTDRTVPSPLPLHQVRKAFASYASEDRDEVLGRIQGMQKVAPDLKVFLDVAELRSGEDWEQKLWQVIPESDVLYLFWSAAAKASPWVEKEWRCGLSTRGEEFIDPVPLVSPDQVRPPEELSKKHFNDWVLAYRRGRPNSEKVP
jgi:molecular chaperone DnaK